MALYNKQKINNHAALKREKSRLRAELKQISDAGFFSADDLTDTGQQQKKSDAGWLGLLSGILTSRTTLDSIFAIALPLLRFFPQNTQKNFLRAFVREFFGGYLKWKGLSLGFKVIRDLLHKKQG